MHKSSRSASSLSAKSRTSSKQKRMREAARMFFKSVAMLPTPGYTHKNNGTTCFCVLVNDLSSG